MFCLALQWRAHKYRNKIDEKVKNKPKKIKKNHFFVFIFNLSQYLCSKKMKGIMTSKIDDIKIIELMGRESSRQEGFRLLMVQYREPIYWHIRRLVVRHEDAEDVMQECFINIYRYFDSFKGDSSLKTWIYKIATNEALRHCTKNRLEMNSYDTESRLIDLFSAEQNINFDTAQAVLQRAILALPEKQRITFNLRYYEDMTYEQIAEVTGSSVATLKTNYHYASAKIKEYVLNNMEE